MILAGKIGLSRFIKGQANQRNLVDRLLPAFGLPAGIPTFRDMGAITTVGLVHSRAGSAASHRIISSKLAHRVVTASRRNSQKMVISGEVRR